MCQTCYGGSLGKSTKRGGVAAIPAAVAHYLVTGNIKDFAAKWADTQIVMARQFLDAVAEIPEELR
jgi:hypothetical protein